MKTLYLFVLTALSLSVQLPNRAQGIYQYWGTTESGGDEDQGTVFTTRLDGNGHKMRPAFPILTPGAEGKGRAGVVYNNKIYTIAGGGPGNQGIIMAFDPSNNTYQKLADLNSIGAKSTQTNLVLYNNKLYGVCSNYSTGTDGFIFEFSPATNGLIRKYNFSSSTYDEPNGGLLLWGDELWGTAMTGGPTNFGGIYSYNLQTGVLTERADFGGFLGVYSYGIPALYNNKIYGVTYGGGANAKGVLYEYNPATDIYTVRHAFSGGNDGINPQGLLTLFNNKFYGQTYEEGANGYGTIFEFDPNTNIFTTKYQNTQSNGGKNRDGFTIYNSTLYCFQPLGGTQNEGTIIQYDPVFNSVTKKVNCSRATGSFSHYQMTLYNNKMYGLAEGGLYSNSFMEGVYYEYNPVANGMIARINFRQNEGAMPIGAVAYHNGKVYGVTRDGGNDDRGVIWEYDLATYTYTVRHHFIGDGPGLSYGMTLHNGKLYGCMQFGGNSNDGALYSFDLATYTFTILHHFNDAIDGGTGPRGRPAVVGNKLYGTCAYGANVGIIWEYDLLSNIYATKVLFGFGGTKGHFPMTDLTEHNGTLWGVCHSGGLNDRGTIFQYFPAINGIIKRYDFAANSGNPESGLTVANNKLYGTTTLGIQKLFEFDPVSFTYTELANLLDGQAYFNRGKMIWNEKNNKLYGTSFFGGDNGGNIFEFDLSDNTIENKLSFVSANGTKPNCIALEKIPAFVAPGNPGNCTPGGSANVDASNWNEWIPFTNVNGDAVVEINPNGNNLGRIMVNFYVHDGATRSKNGFYYLDRNITISSDNQPAPGNPVSVRLYIRKTEFEKIKNTPGSGIINIGSLAVFKNNDECLNQMTAPATQLTTNIQSWGGDYVFTTSVSSFSSFYFASTGAVLPVNLLSFNGVKEANSNKLSWTAACTNPVDFIIERTTDGINFSPIGTVNAQDCNTPFTFNDPNPPVKAYYRLKMTETNASVKYSNIILLNRDRSADFEVTIFPNPVVSDQLNLQVNSGKKTQLSFMISDVTGRMIIKRTIPVMEGTNTHQVPVATMGSGVYQLTYNDGSANKTIRFIKQ